MGEMLEVRWHGLGGMGAVTASDLFASAAIADGKYAQSFPLFGVERRGAPVTAFLRISDEFIRVRTNIACPDIVLVLIPKVLNQIDVTEGLKEDGKIIMNSNKSPEQLKAEFKFRWPVLSVNASMIATETIKAPIFNTAMMGALQKTTEVVSMDSLIEQIRRRFGERANGNIEAMRRAYDETTMGD